MNIQLIGSKFPCFIFNRSVITQRIIIALFSSYSLPLSLLLNDRGRQITKQLLLGQYLLNRKRGKEEGGEIKGEKWSRRNLWLLPPGAVRTPANLREIAGDTPSMRDQRGSSLCFCIPQTLSIMHFPCPTCQAQWPERARTHARTHGMAHSSAWHLTALSAEKFSGGGWARVDSYTEGSKCCRGWECRAFLQNMFLPRPSNPGLRHISWK